jgi:membrane-bound serine protease (ClpP class)
VLRIATAHRSLARLLAWSVSIFLCGWAAVAAPETAPARSAPVIAIEGAIGPATSHYVTQSLADAAEEGAPFAIIRMDTPGGLDTSMREIIQDILRSPVPVVTYVTPSGARAASAGAYILYASHVAAMTPGTNVGAATPVQIGAPSPLAPAGDNKEKTEGEDSDRQPANASDAKAINDAVAYIRSLAELRGRNAEWAEAAVRRAESLSANAALEQGVIEIIARDSDDLLHQLDGRTVTAGGAERRLDTRAVTLERVEPNWRTRLLAAITNPNIALLLMMVGIYGLLFEFMNPGSLYPGTIGAICLLLGLYALAALPVNYAGIALIALGVALMAGEAFSPSFGVLGVGGVAAFVFGATILFDTELPQFRIGWPAIAGLALFSLVLTIAIVRLAFMSRHREVVSGREEMIGLLGTILDWEGTRGHVFVHSERWNASGEAGLRTGDRVRVTGIDGLILQVERWEAAPAVSGDSPPATEA